MQLGITIPFQKFLKVKAPPYGEDTDLFFCWEAHRIVLDGRSTLIVVNANNRFAAVVSNMQRYEWKSWTEIAVDAIQKSLALSGFSQGAIDAYFALAEPAEITKTHGRKPVASLNHLVDDLLPRRVDASTSFQPTLCSLANESLIHKAAGFDKQGIAKEQFTADLERFNIRPQS